GRERINEIIRRLREEYPNSRTALRYETPFQLLIATMLSAQCTDERVNQVTEKLFKKYKTPHDFARLKQEELEGEIRSTGFFRNKAKNIIAASKKILEEFGGEVPDTMDSLIKLPGVARKTANIVLSSAFKKAEGIAVDVHVRRVSKRLGLSSSDSPEKIEKDLMEIVPKDDWIDFNYMVVNHGRRVCKARKPRCEECIIKDLCDYYKRLS
ncbi:MAG: endonuclease III, partial [Nitrospirae bacterium]